MLLEEDRALAKERGWEAAIRNVGIAGSWYPSACTHTRSRTRTRAHTGSILRCVYQRWYPYYTFLIAASLPPAHCIAGIDSEVDPGNIKCLHTHYAHWLGRGGAGNLVGEWVHERLGEL